RPPSPTLFPYTRSSDLSQITDGAAALLILSREKAEALGLRPRARFHSFALAGGDPVRMLAGPIPATRKALERGGLDLQADIDVVDRKSTRLNSSHVAIS